MIYISYTYHIMSVYYVTYQIHRICVLYYLSNWHAFVLFRALLWHRLMGRNVLSVSHEGSSLLRAYAHCSKKGVIIDRKQ